MIQARETESVPTQTTPAWDVARLFPDQGLWSEYDYFLLDSLTGGRVELSDGRVEVLPMPTVQHQLILQYLFKLLDAFVTGHALGLVLVSGTRVRLGPGKFREPDVVYLSQLKARNTSNAYLDGADLAIEVVSEDAPDRDYVRKLAEYAAAHIGEYWIVDPRTCRIQLYSLPVGGDQYVSASEYIPGQKAASILLPGFEVEVASVFEAGNRMR